MPAKPTPAKAQLSNRQLKKQRRLSPKSYPKKHQPAWWQSTKILGGLAGGFIILIILVFVILSRSSSPSASQTTNPEPFGLAPAAIVSAVTSPSPTLVDSIATGGIPVILNRVNASVLTGPTNKPLVAYVGAEYCPYCAATRWSLVMSLANFGSFKNLYLTQSSATDVDPNTNTFTFHGSSYTSTFVDFAPTELQDRAQQPFESPSSQVAGLFTNFDKPPFTPTTQGFPFLDIAGLYTLKGSPFDPAILKGLTWSQIASDLTNPASPVTKAIVGTSNYMTAAICSATKNQPAAVCTSPAIKALQTTLTALPPVG